MSGLPKVHCGSWKVFSAQPCDFSDIVASNWLKTFDCIDQQLSAAKPHVYGFNIELNWIEAAATRKENKELK